MNGVTGTGIVMMLRLLVVALLSLLLMGADGGRNEADERFLLNDRLRSLSARIEEMKLEQDYLLFERVLAATDSKYLVLDTATGKCSLKYRNRILRSFEVAVAPYLRERMRRGSYILTARDDGSPSGRALIFQDELMLHGKRYAKNWPRGRRPASIGVGRMDLAALFYALDVGSMIYIL